jgi:site-specific recombinase XerD
MGQQTKRVRGVFERPKGSGIWWIRYADEAGQIHREKVGMKHAAINIYQLRKTQIRLGKFTPEEVKGKHQNASFAEIIEDRRAVAKSLRSFRDEDKHLSWWKERLKGRTAASILANDIEAAKRDLSETLTPASVNRKLAALKSAFSLAVRNKKADINPAKEVKLFKENNARIRFLTEEEETRLFSVLPKKYKPLVTVAIHTGLRKTEQLSLKWTDVDFKLGQITVRESKPGKSRVIPMNDTVETTLSRLPRRIRNPFVFVGRKAGGRLKDLPNDWEELLLTAKIEDFRWHDLRHTFASRLVMSGVDLYTVCRLLGHQDIK